jgi:4-hydroxy-tetrahydrodipicolinate synthase
MVEKSFKPKGVYPALVTPFAKDESLDEEAFRRLIRFVLPHVDGLFPCGTTGEFPYLSAEEQRRLIEICCQECEGKPVVAGTSAAGTPQAVELAKAAKDAGASACVVVTPYFLHPSDKGVYQHFYDVATAVDLPLVLYNIPQATDAVLPRRVVEDLADIPNVVALKDSAGNLTYTMEILEYCGDRINVLVGHDEVVLNALAGGCHGMMLASANVYPDIWQIVLRAVGDGDLETARILQRSVQKLSRIFCRYGGGVAVKQALKMMGLDAGRPRRPLKSVGGSLTHEDRAEIQLELEKLGKVKPSEQVATVPRGVLESRFEHIGLTALTIRDAALKVGTGSAGRGAEAVQIDLVRGRKDGPLGDVYTYQLTYPRHGFEALTTILEPNLAVRPATLLVPTTELEDLRQANMVYGPTQSAVARAVVDKLVEKVIPESAMEDELIVVQASVEPAALDRHTLYRSVYAAAAVAIDQAFGRI